MKWVIYTLLLMNGIYLAVHLNRDDVKEKPIELFPFSGPRLELLVEREKLEKAKQFAEKNRLLQLAKAKVAEREAVKSVTTKEPEAEASFESTTDTTLLITAQPEPQPQPKAKQAPKPRAVSRSGAMACYSVGPFLLVSDVNSVSQLLNQSQIKAEERSESLRKQVGYWVYIPPLPSTQEARNGLRKIKESGINDAQIIFEGSKANAISAGVFKTEGLGNTRQKTLADLGLKAIVEPLFRNQPQYWLDLELKSTTQLPAKLWSEMVAGYPSVKQLRRKCE